MQRGGGTGATSHTVEALVRRAQAGDAEAFDELVARFQDAAVGYALAWTGDPDDAEDVAQEAFVDVYLKLTTVREPAAFASWFRTVLRKHTDRSTRRPRSVPLRAMGELPADAPGPHDVAERSALARGVRMAVAALPPAQREAVLVHYFGGLTVRETATLLGVPDGTVKRRLHDARRRLRAGELRDWEDAMTKGRPSEDERFAERVRTLIRAAAEGRLEPATAIIAQEPAAIDAEGPHPFWGGRPRALHTAVERGRTAVVEMLLAAGADPDPPSDAYDGWTPLLIAITGGREAIRDRLIAAGAKIDPWCAAAGGHDERLAGLLRSDPSLVHARGPNQATPLHFVVSLEGARLLVEAGADLAAEDQYGSSPVRVVAYSRRASRDAARWLAEISGEVDIFQATALGDAHRIRSLAGGDPALLEKIDSHLNAASAWGGRPLHIAASRGDGETAALLLELGADPNGRARDGETPLHYAAKFGDAAMIRLLLRAGADPTLRDDITRTGAVDWADFFERPEVIPLLRRGDRE